MTKPIPLPQLSATETQPDDVKRAISQRADKALEKYFQFAGVALLYGIFGNNTAAAVAGLALIVHQLAVEQTLIRRWLYQVN